MIFSKQYHEQIIRNDDSPSFNKPLQTFCVIHNAHITTNESADTFFEIQKNITNELKMHTTFFFFWLTMLTMKNSQHKSCLTERGKISIVIEP